MCLCRLLSPSSQLTRLRLQLHASDLRTLAPTSPLPSLLRDAPSTFQRPYVRREDTVQSYADALVARCGARLASVAVGESDLVLDEVEGAKHVVVAYVPAVEGEMEGRKAAVDMHGVLSFFFTGYSGRFIIFAPFTILISPYYFTIFLRSISAVKVVCIN